MAGVRFPEPTFARSFAQLDAVSHRCRRLGLWFFYCAVGEAGEGEAPAELKRFGQERLSGSFALPFANRKHHLRSTESTMSTTEMTKPSEDQAPAERRSPQFSTLSVHGGEARQKLGDSITDPIFCASTYTFAD